MLPVPAGQPKGRRGKARRRAGGPALCGSPDGPARRVLQPRNGLAVAQRPACKFVGRQWRFRPSPDWCFSCPMRELAGQRDFAILKR